MSTFSVFGLSYGHSDDKFWHISMEIPSFDSLPRNEELCGMAWLRLVGSLKSLVSFAECILFYRAFFAKETLNTIDPTNQSHPIIRRACLRNEMSDSFFSTLFVIQISITLRLCVRVCSQPQSVVGTVTHSRESQHNNPLSDTGQNNQESEQSIHNSLTETRVNEERRRLAGRLACKVMLGDGATEAEWRCCGLRVIVITMFFIPLWLEIKTQSRDRSVASTSALARLAMPSFLRPGFVWMIKT